MSVKTWHILDVDQCLALLEARHLGRVAFDDEYGPIVLPINYWMADDRVVFKTHAGAKLNAALRGAPLAFEIDGFDPRDQTGWSVLVRGRAEVVTNKFELAKISMLPLVSWAPGAKPIYVRIGSAEVTGRRIGNPELPALPSHWWG